MRLKEDNTSWKSGGVQRRMYRQAPLLPEQETIKGHPKRKSREKAARKKIVCKHVWVEVSYQEYQRYASKVRVPWWWYQEVEPYWLKYTTHFVCADCLETKTKRDKGKQRAYYRRKYGRSW